jgi:hypothetical protein
MLLSWTPLEDAWRETTPNSSTSTPHSPAHQLPRQHLQQVKTIQEATQQFAHSGSDNLSVVPSNSDNVYDNLVINVDSFHPTRIDVVITDPDLIRHMKLLPYTEQQQLATNVLLEHFRKNPKANIPPNSSHHSVTIPPNSSSHSITNHHSVTTPPNSSSHSITNHHSVTTPPNSSRYTSPNSSNVQWVRDDPALNHYNIEFFRTDDTDASKRSSFTLDNTTLLYLMLAMLCYILYERVVVILATGSA